MGRCLVFLLALVFSMVASAQIPAEAQSHQRQLTRLAQQEFGLAAPVALFAAQIHQESSWQSTAQSPYAQGLSQFTPATAQWISEIYPDLGHAAPYSPGWAMRALLRYNRHIHQRVKPWHERDVPHCDHWGFVLSGYNGGPGWIARDRRLAEAAGQHPDRWWHHTEQYSARGPAAMQENRHYVRRILLTLEPRYRAAGWQGGPTCSAP